MTSRILKCMTAITLLSALAISGPLAAQSTLGLKETVLYAFTGGTDGAQPYAGVIRDDAGNVYGTTFNAGDLSACLNVGGCGTVFKVDPEGNYIVLYTFTGETDGGVPMAGLARDPDGNFYGTASQGGDLTCGCGVVFRIDPNGNYAVLYPFTGADGAVPFAGVVLDGEGNLYGTTNQGGASGMGVVYKLTPGNGGHWTETVLHSFTGGNDGKYPWGGLVRDDPGNLYGTATSGGSSNAGVVFKVDQNENETVLYPFTGGTDGATPYQGLVQDNQGYLYGVTYSGGASRAGVVFQLTPGNGGQWTENVLYPFTGGADGGNPNGDLVRDEHGNLYGTTEYGGGLSSSGVVFRVGPTGRETVLYAFMGEADGGLPEAGLFRDQNGNLYGTSQFGGDLSECGGCGVVFKIAACHSTHC